ncbi:NIPSNAP family protein [Achromobacter pestifer]
MIVEQRTYTTHPGRWRDYLALYEAEGLAVQQRILGRMVGYYYSEVGALNQIVHLWAYLDLNERTERRARLAADPLWQGYVRKMLPLLHAQESKFLVPAAFFKPQWNDC